MAEATQQELQFDAPRARRSDPISSHAAAEHVVVTGIAAGQRGAVLAALRQHPRTTSRELAAASGLDRYMVARRLSELRSLNLVDRSDTARACKAGGLNAVEWWCA